MPEVHEERDGERLSSLSDQLKDAGEDIVKKSKEEAEKAVNNAITSLTPIGDDLASSVDGFDKIRDHLEEGMVHLNKVVKTGLFLATENLAYSAKENAKAASVVITKMAELVTKVLEGKISAETAELSLNNYMHAIRLYGSSIENKAKVEAFKRGQDLLEATKKVLFSTIRLGIKVAVPSVGLLLDAVNESIKPTT